MVLTWTSGGNYTIPASDSPDYPITIREMDGGNYLRSNSGALYNPSRYAYKEYGFSFTSITSATLDEFVDLFKDIAYFTIADSDFGTVSVIPVPGSLSVSYLTKGNCNLIFRVEERVGS